MSKLLSIVCEKLTNQVVDVTMKFTLSALWNLTGKRKLKFLMNYLNYYEICIIYSNFI
jgi:hypothetical protein